MHVHALHTTGKERISKFGSGTHARTIYSKPAEQKNTLRYRLSCLLQGKRQWFNSDAFPDQSNASTPWATMPSFPSLLFSLNNCLGISRWGLQGVRLGQGSEGRAPRLAGLQVVS